MVARVKTFMGTLVRDKPAYVALTAVAQRDKAGEPLQISWIGEDLTEERAMHTDMHDEVVQINKEKEALSTEMHATKAANCKLEEELFKAREEIDKMKALHSSLMSLLQGSK